ncbi:MAG: beta-galactosidase trimerization domain-containing protein, partial [Lentisphaeria bacterium]|nr:beta-galactosidase trimerization domain-containing protein [Lentisphaeria bacterium]
MEKDANLRRELRAFNGGDGGRGCPDAEISGKKWYQRSLRRLLVDMHIPDRSDEMLRDFSPENYADMMALAEVDTAEIYAGSCLGLCYWPTEVGFRHRCLHGRDLLGETVEACRRRGLNIQIYFNFWSRAAYDAHPEWRIVLYDGKGTCEHTKSRFGQCCHNTGYREFFMRQFAEIVERYECSGYWIDMMGLLHYCYCPACEDRFRRETGYPAIPRRPDWNDPVWLAYEQCRANWLSEFVEEIAATVKSRAPERTVSMQSAGTLHFCGGGARERFFQANEFLAGDFTGSRIEQSMICKLFAAISGHRPIEFMTPRCETLEHHTATRRFGNLLMRSYAAVANQASFTLIDAIDPRGTLDRRFYELARRVNSSYARFEKYIDADSHPVCDLAIYHSPESLVDLDGRFPEMADLENCSRSTRPFMRTRMNLTRTLMGAHLMFTFVGGDRPERWKGVPVIFLSDCAFLSEEECKRLEEFVRSGGKLFATLRTSLYDRTTGIRGDFRLAELFGVHFAGAFTEHPSYLAPAREDAIPGTTRDYPVMLNGVQARITAGPEAEVLGTLTMPSSRSDDISDFSSAISDPPMIATGAPAMVRHKYGRGEVVYVAGMLEEVEVDYHREIVAELLKRMLDRPVVETDAPPCVECTLFDQPERRRLVFSCLNLPAELPVLPIRDTEYRVRVPEGKRVGKVLAAPG